MNRPRMLESQKNVVIGFLKGLVPMNNVQWELMRRGILVTLPVAMIGPK